jgi:hypothetical protein
MTTCYDARALHHNAPRRSVIEKTDRALVVCRDGDELGGDVVLRAVRRAGLEPIGAGTIADARRLLWSDDRARGEIVVLVVDVDLHERGDGLELGITAAFDLPPLELVLLHARGAEADDVEDPTLGIALSEVHAPVLRRPVREEVLARVVRRAARRSRIVRHSDPRHR